MSGKTTWWSLTLEGGWFLRIQQLSVRSVSSEEHPQFFPVPLDLDVHPGRRSRLTQGHVTPSGKLPVDMHQTVLRLNNIDLRLLFIILPHYMSEVTILKK